MKIMGERPVQMAAFGLVAAVATGWMLRELTHSDPAEPHAEFTIQKVRYEAARNIGEIIASESFTVDVSRDQASQVMETTLIGLRPELANNYPRIPQSIINGDVSCRVIDSSRERHFDLVCLSTPAEQTTA